MAAEDWIDTDFDVDDVYYEPHYKPIPQAEFQDEKDKWRMADKYVPVVKLESVHLLNCIHMVERKALKEYDPAPKVYKALIKEAKKRKIIKR